jgi:glycosyltransferase involved in cell wall biosynthesis
VGNHGLYSSLSLARIGVSTNKIVPYDFPHSVTPELFSVKLLLEGKAVWNIVYVGAIMESKGVGDTLRSVSILKSRGTSCLLKIVGKGEVEAFINIAKSLDIEDSVVFLGLLPNKEVIPLMREADIVLIPSRHEYPEGFPFTIYEALCSRTPIIASDHPMFINKLIHETNALIFSAGNAESLASSIERLISSSELYNRISSKSHEAWCSLQIPVMWSDFINAWLSASPKDRQWLSEHCLSSSRYF